MLMLNKPKCETNDITTLSTSPESYFHWEEHFHKNPLYFRLYASFEADNEKNISSKGNKTSIIYKQNPICNRYKIRSELEAVLRSGHYKSLLGYDNV